MWSVRNATLWAFVPTTDGSRYLIASTLGRRCAPTAPDLPDRINELADRPEFYPLSNSCTINTRYANAAAGPAGSTSASLTAWLTATLPLGPSGHYAAV